MKNYLTLYLLAFLSLLAGGLCFLYPYFQGRRRELLEAEIHKTSCLIQRNLQGDIKRKRQEYIGYLIESLTLLKKSFNNPELALTDTDRLDILELCLRQAKPLFMGLWDPTNKEVVDLKEIITNIPLLFAEKLHILNITVNIDISSEMTTTILGEPVFMEVILINVIGKIIYRVPNSGKVRVVIREEDGDFHLEIQDNGYILTGSAAIVITHLHDFFITDDAFQEMCKDNDITFSTSKSKDDDMNITYLMFPAAQEEIANRNIEPLFL